jgi:hypothetical protein
MGQGDHQFDVQCCSQESEPHLGSPPAVTKGGNIIQSVEEILNRETKQ